MNMTIRSAFWTRLISKRICISGKGIRHMKKGHVLRDLVNSCKKYGLQVGVYLSPADLYQIENKEVIWAIHGKNPWRKDNSAIS